MSGGFSYTPLLSGSTDVPNEQVPADNMGSVSAPRTISYMAAFDGVVWDRLRSGMSSSVGTTQASADGWLNTILAAQYVSASIVLADTNWSQLFTDIAGNLRTTLSTYIAGEDLSNNILAIQPKASANGVNSPTLYTYWAGAVTKNFIKAAPGVVVSAWGTNINAAVRYFQLHNKATAPAAADVPLYSFPVPAGSATAPSTIVLDSAWFTQNGGKFTTGIGWAWSTTLATFTDAATAGDHSIAVNYY